ncbi:MAG: hypothetical protein NC206_01380 [Bacteroides sp.]|nr:hypothetical protein [Roseburia sp.]MCM1345722.1 hypothetical protein [Bacteroides sp.]MCM1419823.1 hypothetical protein [Bacteroides sp.]
MKVSATRRSPTACGEKHPQPQSGAKPPQPTKAAEWLSTGNIKIFKLLNGFSVKIHIFAQNSKNRHTSIKSMAIRSMSFSQDGCANIVIQGIKVCIFHDKLLL